VASAVASCKMKPRLGLLVGQIASQLPKGENFRCYDLVISSFRRVRMPSELHRLGFEPRILARVRKEEKKIPVSFVERLSQQRRARLRLLEYLCEHSEIEVWGHGVNDLSKDSPIRLHRRGNAWGIDMFQVLHDSVITLNHHGEMSGQYAGNMRLFEATGISTLLLTDWKANLREMFEPEKELVAYHSPEECAELIEYYLEHDDEREAIARVGQQRTLRQHAHYQRMRELVSIVEKHL